MPDSLLQAIQTPADLKKLSLEELPQLAQEIRDAICDQVSKSGGHLAPNLGVVELTIALHYVFDFGHDRLLFDVGHQVYPHKLLTGRLPMLSKLRQRGGMSGFPEPEESPYDLFSVGHAGTAISTAVGMARADTILGQGDRRSVALVGDASIVNGVAMEGLNNAGTLARQFLVVLNDNGMAIAKPQGHVAKGFDRVRVDKRFVQIKDAAKKVLSHVPGGGTVEDAYHRATGALKAIIHPEHVFSQFGLLCVGPVDGHDINQLVEVFQLVRDIERPVLLHAKTIKGKGFDFSTGDPCAFHSPKPFTIQGCTAEVDSGGRSFTAAFSDAMSDMMSRDERVFTVTAAMPDGTGVAKLIEQYPDRTLDSGICESHAMDMCAGMAKAGMKPFFAVYSTFSQRALDQVFQEVALQGLPVRVCMDRAGFVGGDGAVHHGFMDVSMFRVFPGATLLAARDEQTLLAALEFQRTYDEGPSFLRYPRDDVREQPVAAEVAPFELGKSELVKEAPGGRAQLAVIAYGTEVYEALEAAARLEADGYAIEVHDARFAKPIDRDLVVRLARRGTPIVTVEDHAQTGGFGTAVLEVLNEARLSTERLHRLWRPVRWIGQGSRAAQLAETGLDAAGIEARVREVLTELGLEARTRRVPDASGVEVHS